jgi:GNAT superfamily N-acetyltransferase
MQIRPYREEDLAACRELWRELTQHHRDVYEDQTIGGDNPGGYFDTYRSDPKLVGSWVAVEADEVVGLTGLLRDEKGFEIEPVVVRSDRRDRGVGRRLIERMLDEARERGATSVSIRPVARNAPAIRRFHEAGFRTLGHVEMFVTLDDRKHDWKPGIEMHGLDFEF